MHTLVSFMIQSAWGDLMTTVDLSIPYRKVLMVLPKKRVGSEHKLKEGFHYEKYTDDLFDAWCSLQTGVKLFETKEQAAGKLKEMLAEDRAFFEENFLFVMDEKGNLAASAGLWPGRDFDEPRLRIHYVATDPSFQHNGLARSMLTKLAVKYDTLKTKYPLYLATQAQSYGAIRLYASIGFTPYLGAYNGHTQEQSGQDWEETTKILREHA